MRAAVAGAKIPGARDRKRKDGATRTRRDGGAKVEGRKNHAELRPQVVAEAKRLGASGRRAGSGPIARSRPSYFRAAMRTQTADPSRCRRSKTCWTRYA